MLFNSFEFLLVFLPITVVLYRIVITRDHNAANFILLIASLVFYAWWNYPYLVLMLGSIAGNYLFSYFIDRAEADKTRRDRFILAVAFNLCVLGFFKYMDFFIGSINTLASTSWPLWEVMLPIGVSFFTFTQINYLVEVRHRRQSIPNPFDYALFVAFFPHLIAGPILKYSELEELFDRRHETRLAEDLAIGAAIIALGLFKKVVIGDTMGQFADPAFAGARAGAELTFVEAWSAVLCFTVQIYCDFSGYSDMAIGLARLFRVRLPTNFLSPYQAASIIEFWRRWHMTLSRFLREALYIPLGGAKRGRLRRDVNLGMTMLLGGLWHGANWTFVAWGGLHGLYLIANHRFRDLTTGPSGERRWRLPRPLGWALTFLAVVFAWVLFRADSFAAARQLFEGMIGLNGIQLPADYGDKLGRLRSLAEAIGLGFGPTPYWNGRDTLQWLLPSLLGLLLLPNLAHIFKTFEAAAIPLRVDMAAIGPAPRLQVFLGRTIAWTPNLAWMAATALLYAWALTMLFFEGAGAFIYFQF
jgi:alginate O-acetyltransferase complex protein AlgI